jgi:hypothetical protein
METKGKAADDHVQNEKMKALKLTLEKLEKSYGKGAIMKLGG